MWSMVIAALVTAAGAGTAGAQQAELILIDGAGAGSAAAAQDVTPDGQVVVGTSDGRVFRWTEAGGVEFLSPSDWAYTLKAAVSDDGSTIASTLVDTADNLVSAARWTQAGGWTFLGCLPAVPPTPDPLPQCSTGYDISGDGSVIVGLAWHGDTYRAEAFRWTEAGGMVGLGQPTGASSRASAISADGSVIGGFYEHESWGMRRPVRWVGGGASDLFIDPYTMGEVSAISTTGELLSGEALLLDSNGFPIPPWTMTKGFVFSDTSGFDYVLPIEDFDPFQVEQNAGGNGVSDGGIVVGWSGSMGPWGVVYPAIYCPGSERMRDLSVVLTEAGVTIPPDVLLLSATAITPDGTTVVGQALNGATFNYVPFVVRFFSGPCPMFEDGFESGDTAAWSVTVP
jgi:probable HAF family extracellular repeat protein